MANIANIIGKLSGIISSLDDIKTAILNGGGGGSVTASNVSVVPTSPFVSTNLQNLSVEEANAITANAGDITTINTALGNTSISGIGDGTVTGAISTLNSRTWTFLTAIQSNGTYTVPDLSQYKEYQIRSFLTNIRTTLLYDSIANFTTIFPEWTDGTKYVYCKIQKTSDTTLVVTDSTITSMSSGAYFYVYGK